MPSNRTFPIALATAIVLAAGPALAATSQTGSVTADVGQLVEITVPDSSIAAFTEFTPTSGSDTVRYSTSDYLRFSNAKSNVQELFSYGLSVTFTYDSDGSQSTTTVAYQGGTATLTDLVHVAQSSTGDFLPWAIVTGSDLTSEGATGWTTHADCGTMQYQGSFSVASYSNAGVAQSALTRYYRVCDSGTELYLGSSKDLSSGDKAFIYTQAAAGSSATAGNYEVAIGGADYVFYSAASATTVTLRQGNHMAFSTSSATADLYALLKFPDGFPAGSFSATLTATANDIVS